VFNLQDETTFFGEVMRGIAASTVVAAAGWGALGGMTAGLTVKVSAKAVVRQILLGALVAGGVGTGAMALIAAMFSISPELIPVAGAASSASYMVGVFGPAVIEVFLSRIRAGRLPGEGGDNAP
jgi:hypothetical protein